MAISLVVSMLGSLAHLYNKIGPGTTTAVYISGASVFASHLHFTLQIWSEFI